MHGGKTISICMMLKKQTDTIKVKHCCGLKDRKWEEGNFEMQKNVQNNFHSMLSSD